MIRFIYQPLTSLPDPKFNMTEEFCSNIEDHAEEGTIYDDIEEATVRDRSTFLFSSKTSKLPYQFNRRQSTVLKEGNI